MSMIEVGFLLMCAVLAAVGWVVGTHFWTEWYYRLLSAIIVGCIPIALSTAIRLSEAIRLKRRPPYPVCENGCCRWEDYRIVKSDRVDVELVCKCGKRYVKSDQRFQRLLEDGGRQPYKVLKPGHQWVDDVLA